MNIQRYLIFIKRLIELNCFLDNYAITYKIVNDGVLVCKVTYLETYYYIRELSLS